MQRTWTQIGKEHTDGAQHLFARLIDSMQWIDVKEHRQEGMMPAMGISQAIKELRLPKVSHYAITGNDSPCFGLYGIRAHYGNGTAQVYVIDLGSEIIPVCSDFEPKVAAPKLVKVTTITEEVAI